MFDFKNQSIDQVIDKALAMDPTHTGKNGMNMFALHTNLPTMEELRCHEVSRACRPGGTTGVSD